MRIVRWQLRDSNNEVLEEQDGISIKQAKELLKTKGGLAWSEQYRGGDFISSTNITLGNNSEARKSGDCSRKDVGLRVLADALSHKIQEPEIKKPKVSAVWWNVFYFSHKKQSLICTRIKASSAEIARNRVQSRWKTGDLNQEIEKVEYAEIWND